MNRNIFVCAFIVGAAATLGAQSANQSNPYEGTSNPPPDDSIIISTPPQPKPPAAHPYQQPAPSSAQPVMPAQPAQAAPQPTSVDPSTNFPPPDGDDGVVQVVPDTQSQPALSQRAYASDPDGDIVHPAPLPPGELGEGTTIRARLLQRLSTSYNQDGDVFQASVASDVVQDGQVLIPAGSEIDGRVMHISTGHVGGHGSMRLEPETVILPNGSRYRMYAQVAGTPGAGTHVTGEGTVVPNSRARRDGIEYGGAVGAGTVTGALLGGPVGALTGSLIGAGVVTTHLLVSHPQATLDTGTVLLFSLTEPLSLVPDAAGTAPDASGTGSNTAGTN